MVERLAKEVGADDGEFYPIGPMLRGGSGIGQVMRGCAKFWLGRTMEGVAEDEEEALVVWRGNKTDAHWQSSGEEPGGDGDGAEVHEIDEVGVVAEVGVELDG